MSVTDTSRWTFDVSVRELASLAFLLYKGGPPLMRIMMYCRVHICPFDRLIAFVNAGSYVLDIGCGAGLFLALLSGTRSRIRGVGFDPSPVAIRTAKRMAEKAKRRGQDLQFFQLSANQPWPQSEFDVVALVDVLHHIPVKERESAFLSAAARVKPGGLLLYKDMAQRPWLPALMNRLHDLIVARQWITYIPVSHVEKWAARNELTLLHAEEISRLWYRHQLRVFKRYDSSGTTAPNKN